VPADRVFDADLRAHETSADDDDPHIVEPVDGRVAIVTGAGTGIGEEVARELARRGMTVALVGRRREPLEAVAQELERQALVVPADLAQPDAPREIVERVLAEAGRLDVIVNNAAEFLLKLVGEWTVDDFDAHCAVNLRAPFFLVQSALPALEASPAAVVVNVSSAAAGMYRPRQTVYGLTKAGIEHLTKNLAAELAPYRIRVNAVRPGPVDTPIHRVSADPEARLRELGKLVPLGRVGRPEEIARWVGHLVDAEAEWMTGAVIVVDGGRTLGPPEAA
jgi:NAD(P)-dependent dehydrogenase (short-subunit alcohol dehydrogenase family)